MATYPTAYEQPSHMGPNSERIGRRDRRVASLIFSQTLILPTALYPVQRGMAAHSAFTLASLGQVLFSRMRDEESDYFANIALIAHYVYVHTL